LAVGVAAEPPTRDGDLRPGVWKNIPQTEVFLKRSKTNDFCMKIDRTIIIRPKIF